MPSDKDRLYLALYARGGESRMPGGEDAYHWALMTGPKLEVPGGQGMRHHAKETLARVGNPPTLQWVWTYEEKPIPLQPTQMLLVRILIAKVKDVQRLRAAFQNTPVRPQVPGWNCVYWTQEAFENGSQYIDKKSVKNWEEVRDAALRYVRAKIAQHRFDGTGSYDQSKIATWDMLSGKEIVP